MLPLKEACVLPLKEALPLENAGTPSNDSAWSNIIGRLVYSLLSCILGHTAAMTHMAALLKGIIGSAP